MEWCVSPCGKYRVETLKPETFSPALQVIREAFTKDEFVCQGTEVCKYSEAREELLELCADAALDGVSVVAVEIESGQVVTACFNKLQVSDPNISEKPFFEVFAEERCKHPSSKALIQFMAGLDERINTFEIYGVDCSLELMFLATLRQHRTRRLGFLCCKASIDLANKLKQGPVSIFTIKDLGPKYSHMKAREITKKVPQICQMLATAVATQNMAKALNFTVHLRTSFTEFVYKGMNYVERAGFDPYCEVVALRLD